MTKKAIILRNWFLANLLIIAIPPAIFWGIFWAYTFPVSLGLMGVFVGIVQAIVLRKIIPRSYLWGGVTTIGWFAGWWLGLQTSNSIILNYPSEELLLTIIVSGIFGCAQGALLMGFPINGLRWIVLTTWGVGLGIWTFPYVLRAINFSSSFGIWGAIGNLLAYVVSGGIYALMTTIALAQFPSSLLCREENRSQNNF